MEDFLKHMPGLPSWIVLPIVLLTFFLTLWPKIFQFFLDVSFSRRALEREKSRLEILKLRCEIEVLRKSNGLTGENLDIPVIIERNSPAERPTSVTFAALPFWKRFLLGGIGATIPNLVRLGGLFMMGRSGLLPAAGYFLGMILCFIIGGIAATSIAKDRANALLCFLVGLTSTLLIQTGVRTASEYATPVPAAGNV